MNPNPEATEFEALARLAGLVLSNLSVYGRGHAVTQAVVCDAYEALARALAAREQLAFEIRDGTLRINGVAVGERNPLVRTLVLHLAGRRVSQFAIRQGITRPEFDRLLEVLDTTPEALRESGGFARAVETADLPARVVVRMPPPIPASARAAAYYTSGGRKFLDFILGFVGLPSVAVTGGVGLGTMFSYVDGMEPLGMLVMALALAGLIAAMIVAFRKGRRYIGQGIACFLGLLLLVPVLLFGACLLILANGGVKMF